MAKPLVQRMLSSRLGADLTGRLFLAPTYAHFRQSLAQPHSHQRRIFKDLLRHGRRTTFGRDHAFDRIDCPEDYRRRVPVRRYEELQPYIDRMLYGGEADVLWPGRVQWFAESSGTSGPRKQIPVTRAALGRVYQATAQAYIAQLVARLDRRTFLGGKTLFFVGKIRRAGHAPGVLLGDITALNVHLTPWYLDFARAPDKRTTLLPEANWEERLHRIVAATVETDIVHLAGLPTWLCYFGRTVLEMTGRASLREVWPNLLATTVGGVNPQPYLPDLDHVIGGPVLHSEVYNGTEGFYAMQIDAGPMALLPDGGLFHEFVPRAGAEADDFSRAVALDGVQVGEDYALVVSSSNGLWRYLVGDVVRFSHTAPYRLEVRGRVRQSLNIAGEELQVEAADAALAAACAELGTGLVDYTATTLKFHGERENACHLWLVELTSPHHLTGPQVAAALDRALATTQYDYAKFRTAGIHSGTPVGLSEPLVLLLPPGTFRRWLHRRLDGQVGGQSKVPRLAPDPEVAAEVLALLESDALEVQLDPYRPLYRLAVVNLRRTVPA